MFVNVSITVSAFTGSMLISLLVDEILQSKYVNLLTKFSGLEFSVDMAPSLLKRMYSVLLWFSQCILLLALGYAEAIRIQQVYLQELVGIKKKILRNNAKNNSFCGDLGQETKLKDFLKPQRNYLVYIDTPRLNRPFFSRLLDCSTRAG